VARAVAALVSTLATAADSVTLSLLGLLVAPYVRAGIVGVTFGIVVAERTGFFDAANDYWLGLLAAELLAGVAIILLLAVPGIVAWTVLEPTAVGLVDPGETPTVGAVYAGAFYWRLRQQDG